MTGLILRAGRGSSPLLLALAAIPSLLVALPLGYAAIRSSEAGVSGIVSELGRPITMHLLANTLVLAISVTAIACVIGVAAAWFTERCALPGRGLLRLVVSLPLALPALVASYAWSSLGPAFQDMGGAIMILSLSSVPLIYLPVAAAFRGMDPAYEDVARSLGAGGGECARA